jgi:hypothetical protein
VFIGYGVVKENVCGGMSSKFVASVNNSFMNFFSTG